jgi:MFS family permease
MAMAVASYATYALVVLFLINVLNYVVRNVLAALLPLVQAEFGAGDALAGLLGSALMWTYMTTALGFGWLADRTPRNRIVAAGAALWSVAAAACGLASTLMGLFAWRGVVGAGEAAFSSASPAMLADYFEPRRRNRALTFFYIAIPVGSGLGFALGGLLGERVGWRTTLVVTAAPGLLLALLAWALREPRRGGLDAGATEPPRPVLETLLRLWWIRTFRWALVGQTLLTFAIGGVAAWLPSFLVRAHRLGIEEAGLISGGALVLGALLGTVFGGFLADRWERRSRNALVHTTSIGLVIAALLTPFVLLARDRELLFPLLVLVNFFLFWHTGPINALLTNVVPASIRATSVAFQILVIHLFGDAVSPGLIGAGSDLLQARGITADEALRSVLLATLPAALVLAAATTQVSALWAPADLARVIGPHPLDRTESNSDERR